MTAPYRICVICTGNICRSPMGEFLLREAFDEAGLGDRVEIDSAGTTAWEEGNAADARTVAVLRRNGHGDLGETDHVARQFDRSWFAERDLILAADHGHERDLRRMASDDEERAKVVMFRSFDPEATNLDMDDPWYGQDDAFDRTYAEIRAAVPGVVAFVREQLN